MVSIGLTFGIHDEVIQKKNSGQGVDESTESMTSIERMIRKLLQKQKENIDYILNILITYKTKSLLNQLLYPEVQKIREEIERIFNVHINPLFHIIEAHKNKKT